MVVGSALAGAAGGASVFIAINAIDNFSKTFTLANKKMAALGIGLTAVGALGVLAIGKFTKTAIEFESAFAGVKKTVDLSEEGFAELNKRFKDISKTAPITFVELSRIGELAGQLGVSGVDNLEKFTKTIADISVTTNLTSEAAATDFARIANVMQEPLNNIDRMGSTIVDLGNNFATTEAEIATFAQRISGAGKIVGLSTAEVFALGTAFSSIGIEAEAGGSAIQRGLLEMNKAVSTGSEELEIFAKTAGLSVDEFSKLWEEDAAGTFEKFVLGLGTQGDQAQLTLDELGLGGIRTARAFLSMSEAGDLISRTLETGNKAWEENNALTEEANKRYETTQSQLIIFKNKMASLSDQMGRVFLPILIRILDKVGKFIDFLEEHPKLTKFAVVALAIASALAIVLGPLLILVAMLPALIAGFGILQVTILPIIGTVLAIAAAVGIIIAAIKVAIDIFKNWDEMSNKMKATLILIAPAIMVIVGAMKLMVKIIELAIAGLRKIGVLKEKNESGTKSTYVRDITPVSPDETGVIRLGTNRNVQPVINLNGDIYGVNSDDIASSFANKIGNTIKL